MSYDVGMGGGVRMSGGGAAFDWPTTPVPVLGAELLSNGDFGSDVSGWSYVNGNLSSVAGGQSGNALQIQNIVTSNGYAYQVVVTTLAQWLCLSFYHKNGLAAGHIRLATTPIGAELYSVNSISDANWNQQFVVARAVGASTYVRLVMATANNGDTTLFDSVSLKPLVPSSLFSAPNLDVTHAIVRASVTLGAQYTRAGVVCNLDNASNPQNFVIATHDGITARLTKCVAGTYTELIAVATAYVVGAVIEIRRTASSDTYKLYYNGSQVGTDQTISNAGIITSTRHGLFNTYAGNTLVSFGITEA